MTQNRLANEKSLYLQSHADDPVDWYPWGEEAFQRAKAEGKPIFLSIGYSACHWCHVMQRECFKNPEIANELNHNFVSVKVDREEHTDIDEVYMHAVVQMTGSGGWPLSVFLTPDLKPFFGGTYFPPYSRGQYPGFIDILRYIQQIWTTKREQIESTGTNFILLIRNHLSLPPVPGEGQDYPPLLHRAVQSLTQNFDKDNTGWGLEPKFPPNLLLPFLLHYALIYQNNPAMQMVEKTLTTLALSGLHDHIGGGFHRYCIDRIWHVPHFEKMLYDNAQLANVYIQHSLYTQNPFSRVIAEKTLNYILRELSVPEGGFLSSQDADSEHEEGKFYIWRYEEIKDVLENTTDEFCKFFGVEITGNWKEVPFLERGQGTSKNILDPKYAGMLYGDVNECIRKYYQFLPYLNKLYIVREKRHKPAKDNKCIASWNALTIGAFAKGSIVCSQDNKFQEIAIKTADVFWEEFKTFGFLPHILHNSKIEGLLEDYAQFIVAMLDIYEITLNENYLEKAMILAEKMIHHFWDEEGMGFYRTSQTKPNRFPISSKPVLDHQEPSGNAISAFALAKLGYYANSEYLDMSEQLCQGYYGWIQRAPEVFPVWLDTMLLLKHQPVECTIYIKGKQLFPSPMLTAIHQSKYPFFIYRTNKDIHNEPPESLLLFCHHHTCSSPVYKLEEIIPTINSLTHNIKI